MNNYIQGSLQAILELAEPTNGSRDSHLAPERRLRAIHILAGACLNFQAKGNQAAPLIGPYDDAGLIDVDFGGES